MELQFRIKKIRPRGSLAQKFSSLGQSSEIHRIFAKVTFITHGSSSTVPIDAIIDTGAVFSLFPGFILEEFRDCPSENHTLWGIVDAPECHVTTRLAVVPISLIDMNENRSPRINVIGAFSDNPDVPSLLGMKDLLAKYPSRIDPDNGIFTLEFQD